MTLIKINKLKKYYGENLILDIDKFEMFEGDRIGIVGENGAGKTTLLKALLGEVQVDEGTVYLTNSYSYISQSDEVKEDSNNKKINRILNSPEKYKNYLSGGEKVKIKISKAFSENKKLIIADEPTSNLDMKSIEEFEKLMKEYRGSLLLISHDREILNSLCNIIVEIEFGKIKIYKGNYDKYIILKKEEIKRATIEYDNYISEKKRLENAIIVKENQRDSIRSVPKRMGNSEARLHRKMGGQRGKKNIDGNIKSLRSRIEHLEIKKKPKETKSIKIKVQDNLIIESKNLIQVSNYSLIKGDNVLLEDVSFKIKNKKKIALIGDNGTGKTSLVKEIIRNNNEKINVLDKVVIGYFDQFQNILDDDISILNNIRKTSSYNESFIRINLNGFGFKGDSVYKKVNELSGGEKVKIALCKVLLSNNNFIILDEPTNYLDIKSVMALEKALIETEKTLLIISHDRKFISNICDYILEIKDKKIVEFDTNYNEYIKNKNNNNKDNERLLILRNKLSEVISLLSIEESNEKKDKLEVEYNYLLQEINKISK